MKETSMNTEKILNQENQNQNLDKIKVIFKNRII